MSIKSRPKDNRERLFWKSRPNIRPAEDSDLKWLKAAKAFVGESVPDDFDDYVGERFSHCQEIMIIEDRNGKFQQRFGPIGIVTGITNGHLYKPSVDWFPWASPQNILRGQVAFFQKFRYRDLGVVMVHTLDPTFYKRLKKYVPLYYVGKVPGGDELARGDDHIFYMKCRGAYDQSIQV